jgi:hypothetical protein
MNQIAAIDWNEVTALATIGLVIAAVAAAWFAKQDIAAHLRSAEEDLGAAEDATRATQEAARRQIEATYRPLFIDVSEHTSKPSDLDPPGEVQLRFFDHDASADWRKVYVAFLEAPSRVCVAVPLRNVGSGPGVIQADGIDLYGDGIGESRTFCEVHRERVPPWETTRILCTYERQPGQTPSGLWLRVPYTDFAGTQARVAEVRLQRVRDDWRVGSVKPVKPEDIEH